MRADIVKRDFLNFLTSFLGLPKPRPGELDSRGFTGRLMEAVQWGAEPHPFQLWGSYLKR